MIDERVVLYDNDICRLVLEFYRGRAYIHLKVRRWSAGVLKMMRKHWPDVKQTVADFGYRELWAGFPETNLLLPRFAGMFGFREVLRRNGHVGMVVEVDHA